VEQPERDRGEEDDDDQDGYGEDEDGDEVRPMSRRTGPFANAVAHLPSSLRSKFLDAAFEAEKLAPGLTIGGSDSRPPRAEINDLGYRKEAAMFLRGGFLFHSEFVSNQF
jgi:hypothetical protein